MKTKQIIVTMEGGIIQDVTGIPAGIEVKVLDFDEGEIPIDRLELIDGRPAFVTLFE